MSPLLILSNLVKSFLSEILARLSAIILLGTTLFALLEIVRRYIFGVVYEWGQDAVIYSMVAAVALFFAVTQVRRGHLVMSAAVQALTAKKFYKTVAMLNILVSLSVCLFCSSLAVTAWPSIARSIFMQRKTQSLIFDLWPFQAVLMIGLGLMGLIALIQTVEDIVSFRNGDYLDASVKQTTDI